MVEKRNGSRIILDPNLSKTDENNREGLNFCYTFEKFSRVNNILLKNNCQKNPVISL